MAADYYPGNRSNPFTPILMGMAAVIILAAAFFGVTEYRRHSDKSHDPRIEGSQAQGIITSTLIEFEVSTNLTGGPGGSNRLTCALAIMADGSTRWVIHLADQFEAGMGTLAWYTEQGWGGAYPQSLEGFKNGPQKTASYTLANCDTFYPPGMTPAP